MPESEGFSRFDKLRHMSRERDVKKKITLWLDPDDWQLIEEILGSDLLEGVESAEQALLWALQMGKEKLDEMRVPTKPNIWDIPGIRPTKRLWVLPTFDESDLERIRAQGGIPKISFSMEESDPDPSMHALLLMDFGSFEKDLTRQSSDLDVPDIGPD